MTKRKENPKKAGTKPKDPAAVVKPHSYRITDAQAAYVKRQGGAAFLRSLIDAHRAGAGELPPAPHADA